MLIVSCIFLHCFVTITACGHFYFFSHIPMINREAEKKRMIIDATLVWIDERISQNKTMHQVLKDDIRQPNTFSTLFCLFSTLLNLCFINGKHRFYIQCTNISNETITTLRANQSCIVRRKLVSFESQLSSRH
jgi:hypothetical protein